MAFRRLLSTPGPLGLRQLFSQVAVLEKGDWALGFAFTVAVELQVVTSGTPLLIARDLFEITSLPQAHFTFAFGPAADTHSVPVVVHSWGRLAHPGNCSLPTQRVGRPRT